jgi:hypothetical protein
MTIGRGQQKLVAPVDQAPQRSMPRWDARGPVVSNAKRWSNRCSISSTVNVFTRAAASSMANGKPSSC